MSHYTHNKMTITCLLWIRCQKIIKIYRYRALRLNNNIILKTLFVCNILFIKTSLHTVVLFKHIFLQTFLKTEALKQFYKLIKKKEFQTFLVKDLLPQTIFGKNQNILIFKSFNLRILISRKTQIIKRDNTACRILALQLTQSLRFQQE